MYLSTMVFKVLATLVADFIRLNINFIHKNEKSPSLSHPLGKLG